MSERLDINKASKAEIDAVDGLTGHGHEIVRYREERGRFTSLRQLDEVPGMAGKLDDETRGRLRVEG
jgi:competence ComEA-like helix-hairpin-helix protein